MNGAIILAGGKGTRFGGPKQFFELDGIPLWKVVYNKVVQIINPNLVVVVGVDIPGGETRSDSVINGLNRLSSDVSKVMIIEAARPLVTIDQIRNLLNSDGVSITYVKPLVNTVIYRDGTYIDREKLYELLTPQCFSRKLLQEAYNKNENLNLTDETRLINDCYGIKPIFLMGSENLYKVTYPDDIKIIKILEKGVTSD